MARQFFVCFLFLVWSNYSAAGNAVVIPLEEKLKELRENYVKKELKLFMKNNLILNSHFFKN